MVTLVISHDHPGCSPEPSGKDDRINPKQGNMRKPEHGEMLELRTYTKPKTSMDQVLFSRYIFQL